MGRVKKKYRRQLRPEDLQRMQNARREANKRVKDEIRANDDVPPPKKVKSEKTAVDQQKSKKMKEFHLARVKGKAVVDERMRLARRFRHLPPTEPGTSSSPIKSNMASHGRDFQFWKVYDPFDSNSKPTSPTPTQATPVYMSFDPCSSSLSSNVTPHRSFVPFFKVDPFDSNSKPTSSTPTQVTPVYMSFDPCSSSLSSNVTPHRSFVPFFKVDPFDSNSKPTSSTPTQATPVYMSFDPCSSSLSSNVTPHRSFVPFFKVDPFDSNSNFEFDTPTQATPVLMSLDPCSSSLNSHVTSMSASGSPSSSSISEPRVYAPNYRNPPRSTLHCPMEEISETTLMQRFRRFKATVPEHIKEIVTITPNWKPPPVPKVSVDAVVKAAAVTNMPRRHYRHWASELNGLVPGLLPGAHAVEDRRGELVREAGFQFVADENEPPYVLDSEPIIGSSNQNGPPNIEKSDTNVGHDHNEPGHDTFNPQVDINAETDNPDERNNVPKTKKTKNKTKFHKEPQNRGICRPLHAVIQDLIRKAGVNTFSKTIRITVSGDAGGDEDKKTKSTKITVFLNDVENPCSPYNTGVYAVISGTDDYQNLTPVISRLNLEMRELKSSGITVDNLNFHPEYFLTGDVKFLLTVLGLQSASSTHPCPMCLIFKNDLWRFDRSNPPELRNIAEMVKNATKLANDLPTLPTQTKKTQLRRTLGSVHGMPLLTEVEIDHVVVPPLHVIAGAVNCIVKHLAVANNNELKNLVTRTKVYFEMGRSELSGKQGQLFVNKVAEIKVAAGESIHMKALRATHKLMKLSSVDAKVPGDAEQTILDFVAALKPIQGEQKLVKPHLVDYHLLPFLQKHGSWGRFGEQGTEAVHKVANKSFLSMPSGSNDQKSKNFMSRMYIIQK